MKARFNGYLLVGALALASTLLAEPVSGPIDLARAEGLALENSFMVRQARERLSETQSALDQSKSARTAVLALGTNYTIQDQARLENFGGSAFGSDQNWSVDLTATQPLYQGGRLASAVASSELALEAARSDLMAVNQEAILRVRLAFYTTLLAREIVEVRKEAVEVLSEEFTYAKNRFDAGVGSDFERLRAEVALANGQPPLIRARNDYRMAAVDLWREIGLEAPENAEAMVEGSLVYQAKDYDIGALLDRGKTSRPELAALGFRIEAAERGIAIERSSRRPTVSGFAGWGVQKSNFSPSFSDNVSGWIVGVQGRWNVWNAGTSKSKIAQAQSRKLQADLTLREAELSIEVETRRAYSDFKEAVELVEVSRKVVQQAEESLRLARVRQESGSATQLDTLQAQVALTEARSNEVAALLDYNSAVARLERAAGIIGL